MDVQVGKVDIRELQLPASANMVNVAIVCALVLYIVNTVWSLYLNRGSGGSRQTPLLHGTTEL